MNYKTRCKIDVEVNKLLNGADESFSIAYGLREFLAGKVDKRCKKKMTLKLYCWTVNKEKTSKEALDVYIRFNKENVILLRYMMKYENLTTSNTVDEIMDKLKDFVSEKSIEPLLRMVKDYEQSL